MRNLYVIFSESDFKDIYTLVTENDIVLSIDEVQYVNTVCEKNFIYISLYKYYLDTETCVTQFMSTLKKWQFTNNNVFTFENNFYETTYELHQKFHNVLIQYNVIHVIFPRNFHSLTYFGNSKYFSAEFETQGRFLYSRKVTFTLNLSKIANYCGVKISYLKNGLYTTEVFNNSVRLIGLFIYQIFKTYKNKSNIYWEGNIDSEFVHVFRNDIQLDHFSKLDKNKYFYIYYWNSILNKQQIQFEKKHKIYTPFNVLLEVYKDYLIFLSKNVFKNFVDEFGINYKQAVFEARLMQIETEIYYKTLKYFFYVNKISNKFFISSEIKSPYACYDSKIAMDFNLLHISVLNCDLMFKFLPNLFYAKYLHVDSAEIKKSFDIKNVNNVINIVNFKKLKFNNLNFSNYKFTFCLFLDVYSFDENCEIINTLVNNNISFCVKTHPRDDVDKYLELYKHIFFFSEAFNQLSWFNLFEFAITGASGVVSDLIAANKPFLLMLNYGYGYAKQLSYFKSNYYGNIERFEEFFSKNVNLDMLKESFINLYLVLENSFNSDLFYDCLKLNYGSNKNIDSY